MAKAKTYAEKLREWRKNNEEGYAKAIMEPPKKATIQQLIIPPEVDLIMGMRREGKTGLAHRTAEILHGKYKKPVIVHLPAWVPANLKKKIQKLLPEYMKVTTNMTEWDIGAIIIYDETSHTAHARRTQSTEAVDLDNIISVSAQRDQSLIFISHHSRKLDPNIVTEVNKIIWKRPSYAHQLFERNELSEFTMKAFGFFEELRAGRQLTPRVRKYLKRFSLVLDMEKFDFSYTDTSLPAHWSEELSCLFQDIQKIGGNTVPGYSK